MPLPQTDSQSQLAQTDAEAEWPSLGSIVDSVKEKAGDAKDRIVDTSRDALGKVISTA